MLFFKHIYIISALLLLLNSTVYSGFSALFLNIPNGAREISMGETGVSHAKGGSAVWWNPALIVTERSEIGFHTFRWIADGKGSFGGARFKTDWGGLGFYYFSHGMDGFEAREKPGAPQSTFTVHQLTFAAGSGFRLNENISAGFVFKSSVEDIYGDRETGFHALDMGFLWKSGNWSAGSAVANGQLFNDQKDPFPTTVRLGVSHQHRTDRFSVLASLEASAIIDGDKYLHLGIEAGFTELLFLRSGYMLGHDSRDVSYGLGIRYNHFSADLSLEPFDYDLGTVWRFGLGIVI